MNFDFPMARDSCPFAKIPVEMDPLNQKIAHSIQFFALWMIHPPAQDSVDLHCLSYWNRRFCGLLWIRPNIGNDLLPRVPSFSVDSLFQAWCYRQISVITSDTVRQICKGRQNSRLPRICGTVIAVSLIHTVFVLSAESIGASSCQHCSNAARLFALTRSA